MQRTTTGRVAPPSRQRGGVPARGDQARTSLTVGTRVHAPHASRHAARPELDPPFTARPGRDCWRSKRCWYRNQFQSL